MSDPVVKDSTDDAGLSRGEALRYLRLYVFRTAEGLGACTQAQFYELCTSAEAALPPADRRGKFNPQADTKTAEKKLRRLEKDDRKLNEYEYEIAALAMNLPRKFFAATYSNVGHLEAAIGSAHQPIAALSFYMNFPDSSHSEYAAASRVELLSRLERLVVRPAVNQIVLIEGSSMVGKTYLLGQWARRTRTEQVAAIRLDCAGLSVDQIVPETDLLLEKAKDEHGGGALSNPIIFLDGLRIESFREGPNGLGGPAGKKPPLVDLMSAVHQLRSRLGATVAIVMENNYSALAVEADFSAALPRGTSLAHLIVAPLRQPESIEFLRRATQRATQPPEWLFAALADQLQGMPLALAVAAEEMRRLSDQEIQSYLQKIVDAPDGMVASISRQFIQTALDRIRDAQTETLDAGASHPIAFMRLLALMPLPVEKAQVAELLGSGRIQRLGALTSIEELARGLPFVREAGGALDLHVLVKGMLRAELRDIAEGKRIDPFTSASELEWIHRRCAIQNLRMVQALNRVDRLSVSALEAFAHHVTQQIELLPTPQRVRQRRPNRTMTEIIARYVAGEETYSAQTLWDIAYHVVREHFEKPGHRATRMYGQYEAKARIFDLLVRSAEKNALSDDQVLAFLHKEISACWMNAGRLQSANVNIAQCLAALHRGLSSGKWRGKHRSKDGRGIASYLGEEVQTNFTPDFENRTAELWRLAAEAVSFQATVTIRLGRTSYQAQEVLEPFLPVANKIAAWEPPSPLERRQDSRRALDAGAIKVLSRHAEIHMLSGSDDDALFSFALADQLQLLSRGRRLDGEAARKLAVFLARQSTIDPSLKTEAFDIIDGNVAMFEKNAAQYGRISNDVIPFMVMRAGLLRSSGDLQEAEKVLEHVMTHEYFRSGECTYVARQEALVEQMRQRLLTQGQRVRAHLVDELQALSRQLDNSHHYLMGAEVRLLAIEAMSLSERRSNIDQERRYWASNGYAMRLLDLDELNLGGSAMTKFGF